MGRVEGKVAFITGAARGQGRSHAVRLAEEGADIIAIDLLEKVPDTNYSASTQEDLDETVRLVEALGRKIVATKADVRDFDQVKEAVDNGVAQFGKLDIVAANAGMTPYGEWDKITKAVWDNTIATNLTGPWNTLMATVPHLIENGGGSVIITSSVAGLRGMPFMTPYVASKHGVVGLMRAFAVELAEHSIRVNTIHPTGVNTKMVNEAGGAGDFYAEVIPRHPKLGPIMTNLLPVQMTESIDQSNAVLFLASDEARYVTGITFPVDAGTLQY